MHKSQNAAANSPTRSGDDVANSNSTSSSSSKNAGEGTRSSEDKAAVIKPVGPDSASQRPGRGACRGSPDHKDHVSFASRDGVPTTSASPVSVSGSPALRPNTGESPGKTSHGVTEISPSKASNPVRDDSANTSSDPIREQSAGKTSHPVTGESPSKSSHRVRGESPGKPSDPASARHPRTVGKASNPQAAPRDEVSHDLAKYFPNGLTNEVVLYDQDSDDAGDDNDDNSMAIKELWSETAGGEGGRDGGGGGGGGRLSIPTPSGYSYDPRGGPPPEPPGSPVNRDGQSYLYTDPSVAARLLNPSSRPARRSEAMEKWYETVEELMALSRKKVLTVLRPPPVEEPWNINEKTASRRERVAKYRFYGMEGVEVEGSGAKYRFYGMEGVEVECSGAKYRFYGMEGVEVECSGTQVQVLRYGGRGDGGLGGSSTGFTVGLGSVCVWEGCKVCVGVFVGWFLCIVCVF